MSNQVEIIIEGGLVQNVKCPPGTTAVVFDYDIEGATEILDKDNNGKPCFRIVYENDSNAKCSEIINIKYLKSVASKLEKIPIDKNDKKEIRYIKDMVMTLSCGEIEKAKRMFERNDCRFWHNYPEIKKFIYENIMNLDADRYDREILQIHQDNIEASKQRM